MSATTDGRPFVFVSYASLNRERVIEIVDSLEAIGVATWFDRSDIPGGTSYGPEIVAGIKNATALLLMCSEASLASRNVRQEIQLAWRHETPILPLLLEPLVFPDDVSYWLEGAQWIEVLDLPAPSWMPEVRRALTLMGYASLKQDTSSAEAPGTGQLTELPPNNLPALSGPLIGRERELRHLRSLLEHGQMITLTGAGGSGKTRLAEEAARESAVRFPDGLWFVDAASATDPASLTGAIAAVVGMQETPGEALVDTIAGWFAGKSLLLLIDNLEQVVDASSVIDRLVGDTGPTILATSRAPLKANREMVVAVSPLDLPDVQPDTPTSIVARNPAVQLFVAKARQVKPDFQLSDGNAYEVAAICARLDGLPLAIELAAARSRLLNPSAILARLDQRFSLLSRGSTRSGRQQTLYSAIAWSYDLLSPQDQATFRRFSVFSGGATIELAESTLAAMPDTDPIAILDSLDELLDQSLIELDRHSGSGETSRIRMLETIREFAASSLEESGETDAAKVAHAEQFGALVSSLVPDLTTGSQQVALADLATEQANIYAAIDYLRGSNHPEHSSGALSLTVSLWRYWLMRSMFSEGRRRLDLALELPGEPSEDRARALDAAGVMAFSLGDLASASNYHQASLDMATQLGASAIVAQASDSLGIVAVVSGDATRAVEHFTTASEHYEAAGDSRGVALALEHLSGAWSSLGDLEKAADYAEQSLRWIRTQGDQGAISYALQHLGIIQLYRTHYESARQYFAEALALAEGAGDELAAANALANLGSATEMTGDLPEAERHFDEAARKYADLENAYGASYVKYMKGHLLRLAGQIELATELLLEASGELADLGASDVVALSIEALAGCMLDRGRAVDAATMLAAAESYRLQIGVPLPGNRAAELDGDRSRIKENLGNESLASAWSAGSTLNPGEAFAIARRA